MRLLATVRARTVLGASLALGIGLLLSASTAGALLRRSLIRNIDEVAEVRAADVAALASRGELPDISARALDRRVPQSGAGDEVDRLGQTMNAMLDRLEASAERQRRFVADSSEELVAPLAATRHRLEAGLATVPAGPEGGWPATGAELLRQHRRMERLVRDLLYLARVDAGAPRAPLVPVDLDDVVLAEVTRLRGTGPVRFETGAVSAAPIEGRPEDLRRAVRNLLENAERHARTTVRVGLWTGDDGRVRLVVEDDGAEQLPPERDAVFERFTHLPTPQGSGAEETGSGLALAIVRDIAVTHG